jgi:hypothetical protein
MSDLIKEILKQTPLETRLKVLNEMMFIDLITEMGFREDKMWTEEENDQLSKLCNLAKKLTDLQLTEIKKWEEDGRPDDTTPTLTILTAEMLTERRNRGLHITFTSKENLVVDSYLSMVFDEKFHYFRVTDVSISGDYLSVTAIECGYWASFFDRNPDFDLRTLIGATLEPVIDNDRIKRIREMSCWC